jgi:hypothetical protein
MVMVSMAAFGLSVAMAVYLTAWGPRSLAPQPQ